MTHKNNYEYVKKWRENNKVLNNKRACIYSQKYYNFKKVQKELFNIDIEFFN